MSVYCLSNKLINGCRRFQAQQLATVVRPLPGKQTVPDPPQSLFSLRPLCFNIFFVLLRLWFLIELPRSDTSSGCYIILSPPAPSARPLSDSHHTSVSWETGGWLKVSDWSVMIIICLWLAEVGQQNVTAALWQVWPVSDGWEGLGGREPQGAQNMREPGDNSDMCRDSVTCYDTGTTCSRHYEALSRAITVLSNDLPTDMIF